MVQRVSGFNQSVRTGSLNTSNVMVQLKQIALSR